MNDTQRVKMSKEEVEALAAKMPPEQQAKFMELLHGKEGVHVTVDKNGNTTVVENGGNEAVDNVVEMKKDAPKKPSKMELKQRAQFAERIKRTMNSHPGMTQEQALQKMQREDYEKMPVEQKFKRLESLVANTFQRFGQDLMEMHHNMVVISNAYDINYRAIARMFDKLGIPTEEHKKFVQEAHDEVVAERKARLEEERRVQEEARKKAIEEQEKAQVGTELKQAESGTPEEPKGSAVPEGATVFGG